MRNRAMRGEFEYTVGYDSAEEPIKDVIKAVYPTVISPELFRQAEEARADTGFGRLNPSGKKMLNLFEKRSHCAKCGGFMAVRHGRNEKKAFFCRNKAEGGDCDAPNMPYLETRLLDQVADFRWEEYFGDPKHDAERASAATEVERLGQVVNAAQGVVDNLIKSIDIEVAAGRPDSFSAMRANRLMPEKEAALNEAKLQQSVARRKLDNLRRRRNGASASKDARKRIAAFLKTGRDDLEQRREFNLWMRDESLVFVVDSINGHCNLSIGRYQGDKLVEVMETEWVAGHLTGKDRERYLADVEKFKNSNIDNEIAMAKREEEERRRNRVPMTPEQEAELKAWVAKTQKEVAEHDRLRQQQQLSG